MTGSPRVTTAQSVVQPLIDPSLSEKVARQEGPGDIDAQSPDDQFIRDVEQWILRWLDATPAEEVKSCKPAVFLFSGDCRVDEVLPQSTPELGFGLVADASISGNVYFSSLGMRAVHSAHIGFAQSTRATAWCSQGQPNRHTAVIFVPKSRQGIVHRSGQHPDDCERMEFGPRRTTVFTFDEVKACLDDFHDSWTKTHHSNCRVWAVSSKRKLKPGPEGLIQGALVGYLKLVVRADNMVIDQEIFTQHGRADVRITHWPKVGSIETCYLELKVLSKDKSPDENLSWALSGIDQVVSYREREQINGPSYLCCYDGRERDEKMPAVERKARKHNVIPKRFFMETVEVSKLKTRRQPRS